MSKCLLRMASVLLPIALCAATREDTARFAANLKAIRGKMWLTENDHRRLQSDYQAWIDTRLKAGGTVEVMNDELRKAGLFFQWPDTADTTNFVAEEFKSHAGYLETILTKPARGNPEIFVIASGIYKGFGCSLDVTASLYQRSPLKRLGQINAAPDKPEYAYRLSGLDVGKADAAGQIVVASGWAISNCTSSWNGKRIRIDRVAGSAITRVFVRELFAQDRIDGDNVAARVQDDVVSFSYQGGIGDSVMLSGPSVARYRIIGNDAVLAAPVALTRSGFVHEWLSMTDDDAIRWGEAQAIHLRKSVAAAFEKYPLDWKYITQCGGSPPVWEVAVRDERKKLYVFRISGSRATEMRMLTVSDQITPSCAPIDIRKSLESIGSELPW